MCNFIFVSFVFTGWGVSISAKSFSLIAFLLFLDEKKQKSRATEKKAKNYSSGVK